MDSESFLEKMDRKSQRAACISLLIKTLSVIVSPNTEAHTVGWTALLSFLKLFTIPSGSPALELHRDLIWDKQLKSHRTGIFS